jgi:hypothetical protein
MLHAGLPTGVDWRNQDAVAIGKIAQVVSLNPFIKYSLLYIAKASSRNEQLRHYKGNWATIEIMKTLLKNRRSYRNRIGLPDVQDIKDISREKSEEDPDWDDMYMKNNNEGNEDRNGSGNGSEDEDRNSGEGNGGGEDEDGEGTRDGDDEEVGAKDNGGSNGEGSSSAKQAGKRKATQDDKPATTTRSKKLNDSEDRQVAAKPTKKAVPKGKQSKK